jgi:hypothetical protein
MKHAKLLFLVMIAVLSGSAFAEVGGNEAMDRIIPTNVLPNSTFEVRYVIRGATGLFAVSVADSIEGSCTPASIRFALADNASLGQGALTKVYTIQAPMEGACKFVGTYKFGSYKARAFPTKSVTIGGNMTPLTGEKATPKPGGGGSSGGGGGFIGGSAGTTGGSSGNESNSSSETRVIPEPAEPIGNDNSSNESQDTASPNTDSGSQIQGTGIPNEQSSAGSEHSNLPEAAKKSAISSLIERIRAIIRRWLSYYL